MTLQSKTDARLVLTTVASAQDAQRLARALVESSLVACATILPQVRSIYRWKGKVEEESETLILLKTIADCIELLEKRLGELHPYDVPEFLVFDVSAGSNEYLAWLADSTYQV